ncbi:MAG: FAD-dependent oxidoreductase [Thermoleophilia bacterium]
MTTDATAINSAATAADRAATAAANGGAGQATADRAVDPAASLAPAARVRAAREPIVSCEQCGMCSSACPITGVEDFNIRRIERAVQLGVVDRLLESRLPWLCTTCGRCEAACPNGYKIMTTTRTLRAMMAEEFTPPMAPCRKACPAGMDAPRYIRMIAEGRFADAYKVIRETAPLPGVLGRVCAHPCEDQCRRTAVNQPISICSLKRFAYDQGAADFPAVSIAAGTGKSVAVVGSGPAGLTTAFYLRKQGHAVTLLEAREEAGGMLRYGIPAYRLPQEVLDKEIGDILGMGVDFRPGTALGDQVTLEQLRADHDAVLLAVGAQQSRRVKLEGADHPDVLWGVEYLVDVRAGKDVRLRGRVAVVGGGNVAVDVALTALRTGATSVVLVSLESREEMPAFEWEVEEALQEGVELVPSWGPGRILTSAGDGGGDGGGAKGPVVTGMELVRCTSVFDESGGFCPLFSDEQRELACDQVILAIGQSTDLSFLDPKGAVQTLGGMIDVDLATQATGLPGVFAAGDAAAKAPGTPGTIISAIAAGRRAAAAIDAYLGGDGDITETLLPADDTAGYSGEREPGFAELERIAMPVLDPAERVYGFQEVACGFDLEAAVREARRCLNCDLEIVMAREGGPAASAVQA